MSQSREEAKSGGAEETFLSEYIAPWALPKEEIPIHVVWSPESKFDNIQVLLPKHTVAKQFFNVKSYSRTSSEIRIHELHSPNFFGLTVVSKELIRTKHQEKEVKLNFFKDGKVAASKSFIANIYRPELSVVEKPEFIVLNDNSKINELLNICLKISGFGSIEVSTEISFGGAFQPNVEPIYQEMARRFATFYRKDESGTATRKFEGSRTAQIAPVKAKKGIEINPLFLKKTAREFIDKLKKGESLSFTKEEIDGFKKWVERGSNAARLQKFLSEHLESIIMESLLYYFNKYPTDGVAMSGGNPSAIIRSAVQLLRIRFRYKDSMWNEYEPIPVEIVVKDNRTDKGKEVKLPINIKWIQEKINPIPQEVKC